MITKIVLTITASVVAVILLASFQQQTGNARVEKIEGVDVYAFSVPLRDYEVIKSGITTVFMGQCDGMVSRSAKKAAEEKADGVIIHFENFKYEAIKYK